MNRPLTIIAVLMSAIAISLAMRHQTFTRVDAGGQKLRMLIAGQAKPTVVFEAGAGGTLDNWVRVQGRVSQFARTVSYDRAGNGLSDKSPDPRDGAHVVAELHTALQNTHLAPPYVLVGHSLGGPFIRLFAATYPREVAGLVLVDPTQEDFVAWAKEHAKDDVDDDDDGDRKAKHAPQRDNEVDCAPQTFAELKDKAVPAGIAVTLISGMGPHEIPPFITKKMREEVEKDRVTLYPAKLQFHKAWVGSIPGAQLIVTQESGHGIPYEEPELVAKAIREVVGRVAAQ